MAGAPVLAWIVLLPLAIVLWLLVGLLVITIIGEIGRWRR